MNRDPDEDDFRALSRDALRRRRLWLLGIAGNALVALVLLGGPYWRGRERALEVRRDFAALCACLWAAEVAPNPGLTLPPDDLPAYADASRDPAWPARCVPTAETIAPEAAFWLFPDTRTAENDLRRARAMVVRELREAPSAADPTASIPMRPRLAILRLAAAIGVLAREADVSLHLDAPAILLPRATTAGPERVPLRAMHDADVEMRPWAEGVELLALDARGVSWTRVGGGRVDHRRLRRPALVSGVARDTRARPWLIWSTPEARCVATGCARQALGVAPLGDSTVVTPTPRWLAAHPWRGPRSVAIGDDAIWVLALTENASAELRRFAMPIESANANEANANEANANEANTNEANTNANEANTNPARAELEVALPVEGGAVVDVGRVTFPSEGSLIEWTLPVPTESNGSSRAIDGRVGTTRAFGLGTIERRGPLRLARSDEAITIVHDDGRRAVLPVAPDGSLRAVAGSIAIGAVVLGRDRMLHAIRCAPACGGWIEVARGVHAFDVVALGDALVVAYVHRVRGAQIVRRIDDVVGAPTRPGACFREGELLAEPTGMCGAPLLAASHDRVIVGARDGEDVLVVESSDGREFAPLQGLR